MSKRRVLDRAAILGADDLKTKRVPVPEWGGDVSVRIMTGHERAKFVELNQGKSENDPELHAGLIALCLVDDNGARIFEDGETSLLLEKSHTTFDRLLRAAMEINGMGAESAENAAGN